MAPSASLLYGHLEDSLLAPLRAITGLTVRSYHRYQDDAGFWNGLAAEIVTENRPPALSAIVGFVRESLLSLRFADEGTIIRICVALTESLDNALYHGNLELSSSLRKESSTEWEAAVRDRSNRSPFKDRRIFVRVEISVAELAFTIRDEGPGFDPADIPDPTNPDNLEQVCGRGVFLTRSFMDEVRYNDRGNEVLLRKHARPAYHNGTGVV